MSDYLTCRYCGQTYFGGNADLEVHEPSVDWEQARREVLLAASDRFIFHAQNNSKEYWHWTAILVELRRLADSGDTKNV